MTEYRNPLEIWQLDLSQALVALDTQPEDLKWVEANYAQPDVQYAGGHRHGLPDWQVALQQIADMMLDRPQDDDNDLRHRVWIWMITHRKSPYYGAKGKCWFNETKIPAGIGDAASNLPEVAYKLLSGGDEESNHMNYKGVGMAYMAAADSLVLAAKGAYEEKDGKLVCVREPYDLGAYSPRVDAEPPRPKKAGSADAEGQA
jgi:hypothetical protein